ncbi:MAG: hypothetical protein LBQ42_04165 [Synergistaceae bacterium]|nr:hypothetical protein [Synergistaceae bacterium]
MTILVMTLFTALCVAMLSLSQMNARFNLFFERRSILEQATLSLAQELADEIVANADAWWAAEPNKEGKGELNVNASALPGVPQMKFTYVVTPKTATLKGNRYVLFVRGEYAAAGKKADDTVWGVSLDIYPDATTTSPVEWSKHVQLN